MAKRALWARSVVVLPPVHSGAPVSDRADEPMVVETCITQQSAEALDGWRSWAAGNPSPPSSHALTIDACGAAARIVGTTRQPGNTAVLARAREANAADVAGIVGTTLLSGLAAVLTRARDTHPAKLAVIAGTTRCAGKTAVLARAVEAHRATAAAAGVAGARSVGEADPSGRSAEIPLLVGIGLADPGGAAALADRAEETIDRLLAILV